MNVKVDWEGLLFGKFNVDVFGNLCKLEFRLVEIGVSGVF